jgi:hypothetical protein
MQETMITRVLQPTSNTIRSKGDSAMNNKIGDLLKNIQELDGIDLVLARHSVEKAQRWDSVERFQSIPWMKMGDWWVRLLPPAGNNAVWYHVLLPTGQFKSVILTLAEPWRTKEEREENPLGRWEVWPVENYDDWENEAYYSDAHCDTLDTKTLKKLIVSPVPSWDQTKNLENLKLIAELEKEMEDNANE